MPPRDPFSPLNVAKQSLPPRGIGQNVDMTSQPSDPLTALRQMQMQGQQSELERIQMRHLQQAQEREEAQAQAAIEKAELETEEARAAREELVQQRAEARKARMAQNGSGGEGSLTERLIIRSLEQGEESQKQVAQMRESMVEQLSGELTQMRQEMREMMAGPDRGKPYDVLSGDLTRLKEIRELIKSYEYTPATAALGAETSLTIKQLEMKQDFELRKDQLQMEREERQRKWDQERDDREAERQVRLQEIEVRRERDQMLGRTLDSVAPRIADAFSGMQGGPPHHPGYGGGPVEAQEGPNGSVLCLKCGTPIPIGPESAKIECPNPECRETFDLTRD